MQHDLYAKAGFWSMHGAGTRHVSTEGRCTKQLRGASITGQKAHVRTIAGRAEQAGAHQGVQGAVADLPSGQALRRFPVAHADRGGLGHLRPQHPLRQGAEPVVVVAQRRCHLLHNKPTKSVRNHEIDAVVTIWTLCMQYDVWEC